VVQLEQQGRRGQQELLVLKERPVQLVPALRE
jgi:hypothetical protein